MLSAKAEVVFVLVLPYTHYPSSCNLLYWLLRQCFFSAVVRLCEVKLGEGRKGLHFFIPSDLSMKELHVQMVLWIEHLISSKDVFSLLTRWEYHYFHVAETKTFWTD